MENNKFEYTYKALSIHEKQEIEYIKKKYAPKDTENKADKAERVKQLDKKITDASMITGLVIGVLGCLIFGGGLALVLVKNLLLSGIPLSLIGGTVMGFAYPAYRYVFNKQREKYAPEILKLSEEILNETDE